jgi:ABC-type branched-subunit amino acid transport system substrate-binding protein
VALPPEVKHYPPERLQESLKEAYQNYYKIKGSAKELWQMALEALAEAIANEGNATKEKTLKMLRERESQRNTARKLRFLRGKTLMETKWK